MQTHPHSPAEPATASDPATQRNILIAVCSALIAVIASVSGLNVAQQDLAIDLEASQSAVLWIINAYTVALAALLLPIGAVGDRWGRKPVLLAGLAVFGAASLGAAVAPTVAIMIVARIIAGIGAAMIMPVTLSVITSTFPPEDRARAIGIWAGFAGSGGILGLFVSAFMVDVVTWRWSFVLPIVLVAVSAAATVAFVPNSRERSEHRFDIGGSLLSAIAIGGIVLGIHEGPERGWADSITLAGIVVGVAALVAFVLWEQRQADPLLDMAAFRDRGLSSGSSTLLIVFAVMFGIFLVLFPYLQAVVGWTALQSAAGLLPMAGMMMPMSTLAPRIAARVGSRTTMIAGVSIFGAGLVTLALRASVEGGYFSILPGLILIGLGMGLTMTPATEAITATLPAEKQGVASALNDTSREVGGALGVALLGSILSSGYRSAIEPSLDGLSPELSELASEGIGSAYAVAAEAGADGPRIIDAAQHAFVDGWVSSMWVGVVMAAVALAILVVRGPGTTEAAEPAEADASLEGAFG
ncbi:MFS transporter [Ilumatobacter coccineus]|uniref:Putative drug resistance transporter n=1 Tax=Ilumatobacter coccineus (strain NBRC 103263 / KCTC 29153 / YM16-304) TaxID=1313172 RepID=A0A6C7DZ74_ILUCY|nr:MFS transporter [Ilumatobacter coccineus]BAN01454.1 putative drug resistance transporter [Ilumatobacter coccineus YM16-304]